MGSWRGKSRGPVIAFLNQFKDRLEEINFDRAGVGASFATDFESFGFCDVNGINVGEATQFPTVSGTSRHSSTGPCGSAFTTARCPASPTSLQSCSWLR